MKITLKNSLTQNCVDVQRTRHPVGTLWYFRDRASAYFSVGENLPLLDLCSLIGRDLATEDALRAENTELKALVAKYAEGCDPKKQLARILGNRAERLANPKAYGERLQKEIRERIVAARERNGAQ